MAAEDEYKQMLDLVLSKVNEIIEDIELELITPNETITGLVQIKEEIESCGTRPSIILKKIKYTEHNCYDQRNDVCNMGHSAGTGSPLQKCCQYCDEWGRHPGGIIVVNGEEVNSNPNPLTEEIIKKAYEELIKKPNNHRTIYVAFDDLFRHIRENHIKQLKIEHFKQSMHEFWKKDNGQYWGSGKGSSIRAEVRKYAFDSGRGLVFYIGKIPQERT